MGGEGREQGPGQFSLEPTVFVNDGVLSYLGTGGNLGAGLNKTMSDEIETRPRPLIEVKKKLFA